jgi:hypothetical protein
MVELRSLRSIRTEMLVQRAVRRHSEISSSPKAAAAEVAEQRQAGRSDRPATAQLTVFKARQATTALSVHFPIAPLRSL